MTTAKEIQAAKLAGLSLAGRNGGELQWMGTARQWQEFQTTLDYMEFEIEYAKQFN